MSETPISPCHPARTRSNGRWRRTNSEASYCCRAAYLPMSLTTSSRLCHVRRSVAVSLLSAWFFGTLRPAHLTAQEIPHLDRGHGSTQLIVAGQPFIIFGGELSNSAAGTAAQADRFCHESRVLTSTPC